MLQVRPQQGVRVAATALRYAWGGAARASSSSAERASEGAEERRWGSVKEQVEALRNASCNVPDHILDKVDVALHREPAHPLCTIKEHIVQQLNSFATQQGTPGFDVVDAASPVVRVADNFDVLCTPTDHVSRHPSETYYVNDDLLLRCHTSAHQVPLLKQGRRKFLVVGDVYRRDTVDATHYPVFHQLEGVATWTDAEAQDLAARYGVQDVTRAIELDLKAHLEHVVHALFGEVESRWVDATFPFTHPSWELEIRYRGEWIEMLGCGKMNPMLFQHADAQATCGWAFGVGLERLAMKLFDIPDIRLFWSSDPRFKQQFQPGEITQFQPYSKFPPCYKDVSMWVPDSFYDNDMAELVRQHAGDLVESVQLIDEFSHPKTSRRSLCYRINYRSMDRSLTNDEINDIQERVRADLPSKLGVELR